MSLDQLGTITDPEELKPDKFATELTGEQRANRDRFIQEYMKDLNALAACLRLGYNKHFAEMYSQSFMDEPYVRTQLALAMVAEAPDEKEEIKSTKRLIRARLLKEATNYGPGSSHSARVAALAKLASLYDMEAAQKIKAEHTHRGNVMMVPAIANLDEWEASAVVSQRQLATDARH